MTSRRFAALALAALLAVAPAGHAQHRLAELPGHETHREMAPKLAAAVKLGAVTPRWARDGASFEYAHEGGLFRFDVATLTATRTGDAPAAPAATAPSEGGATAVPRPAMVFARGRGKEADIVSPDRRSRAYTLDGDLWITSADGSWPETRITADGGAGSRIRNGVGSYLYLEEFDMVDPPVWWSPDSSKLAWLRFDEREVDDHFLQVDQLAQLPRVHVQAYPHAGAANPAPDLLVHDVATGLTLTLDIREGEPFGDDVVGHYAFDAAWTKDGRGLTLKRADRRQKVFDLALCDAATGACRSAAREERPETWARGETPVFFADGRRFLWITERSGFRNIHLYDLDQGDLGPLTRHAFDVVEAVKIDEAAGRIWYTARSGDAYTKVQLHRMRLDGSDDRRVTDPALDHRVHIAPDGRHIVDVAQAHDRPPQTRLLNADGRILATVARSDVSGLAALGKLPARPLPFLAADGETHLYGLLQVPSGFDPARRYPLLVSVYGGPDSTRVSETYAAPDPLAEYGFVTLRLDGRTARGLGRRALDSIYQQIGVAEVDDIAQGIRAAAALPFVDAGRVGVHGTSYGGFVSAMLILRYPELVHAAAASSPVSDFRLYDSAYSERFLGLPQTDAEAYDRASLLARAGDLEGDLLLWYGTADDNVHPKNTLQLIAALEAAGRSFDVQVGPDRGHGAMPAARMMEFFIERLVMRGG